MIAEVIDLMEWDVTAAITEWTTEQCVEMIMARIHRNQHVNENIRVQQNIERMMR